MAGENAKVHKSQTPDTLTIESGGNIDVRSGGKITAAGTQASAITAITDNTGGSASSTLAAITAGGAYAQADLTAIKNGLASIAAKQNSIIAALQGAGILP